MGLRVRSGLLSSCCARLQLWSSLEADTGLSWGPSSWLQGLLVYLSHPVTQCQLQGFLGAVASILSSLAVPQGSLHS